MPPSLRRATAGAALAATGWLASCGGGHSSSPSQSSSGSSGSNAPTLSLAASPSTTQTNESVLLFATVNPPTGTSSANPAPTGEVTFTDESGANLCQGSAALDASGEASCVAMISSTAASDTITASYTGDANYPPLSAKTTVALFVENFAALAPPDGGIVKPLAINNAGMIAGILSPSASATASSSQAFIETGGSYTFPNYPGAAPNSTNIVGINDSGAFVGSYQSISGTQFAFVYSGGSYATISYPGAPSTTVSGINNSDTIVGAYYVAAGAQNGFIYSGGKYTSISYPGAISTSASAINNDGDVVGLYQTVLGENLGFLYSGGTYTTISAPYTASTYPLGINDNGEIVGIFINASYTFGFFYSKGAYTPLIYPNATQTLIYGVNNSGTIVGAYLCGSANSCGFVGTGGP